MEQIISSEKMRLWEQANFDAKLAAPLELMFIAGKGCAEIFLENCHKYGKFNRVVIFSGHGNNGGDGVVIASLLAEQLDTKIVLALALPPEKLSVSSRYYFEKLHKSVQIVAAEEVVLNRYDLVIDALLGTGCTAPMREPYRTLIEKINQSRCPVFSVDLASGLGSDAVVKADMTMVIGSFKDVLFTAEGIENSGLLYLVELPLSLEPENSDNVFAATRQWFAAHTPDISRNIHKYQRGSVLVAGGSQEYFQAPFLTARAALRNGSGLVRLMVPFAIQPGCGTLSIIPTSVPAPEGALDKNTLEYVLKYSEKADCIAVGPGLGRKPCSCEFIAGLAAMDKPLLLDADALFFVAQLPELFQKRQVPAVMTPHRGEAQMLAKGLNKELPEDDVAAARMLASGYTVVVLLKGPRTAVAALDGRVRINTTGTPALATAGSGDVLTGIIAAGIARFRNQLSMSDVWNAASYGAFLHGLAGEKAEEVFGSCGVIADDLPEIAAQCIAALKKIK